MFKIMGMNSDGVIEEIDSTDTKSDAKYLVGEYKMAFGNSWSIWFER